MSYGLDTKKTGKFSSYIFFVWKLNFDKIAPNIPKNLMFLAEVGYWMFFILTHSLGMRLEIILDVSSVSYFKNMIYGSLYIDTGHAFILMTYYA